MAKAASEKLQFLDRQADLFGAAEKPAAAAPRQFDTHQLLAFEKDAFGFYFSSHPLEPYRAEYEALGLTPLTQVEAMRDGTTAKLGGVVTQRRSRKDKRDREYVIITVEDFDGAIEVMVFADQLEACRSALKVDNLVAVQGTVKVRSSEGPGGLSGIPQVWADRVMSFADCNRYIRQGSIELREQELDDVLLMKVKETLEAHPGSGIVRIRVLKPDGKPADFRIPEQRVEFTNALITELRRLCGPDAVKLRGELPACERTRSPRPQNQRPAPR
jgi:DNA polymerase III alpha subunit